MNNLLLKRKVHIICHDHIEYDRDASLLEIEKMKMDKFCNVKNKDGGITFDFRLI